MLYRLYSCMLDADARMRGVLKAVGARAAVMGPLFSMNGSFKKHASTTSNYRPHGLSLADARLRRVLKAVGATTAAMVPLFSMNGSFQKLALTGSSYSAFMRSASAKHLLTISSEFNFVCTYRRSDGSTIRYIRICYLLTISEFTIVCIFPKLTGQYAVPESPTSSIA